MTSKNQNSIINQSFAKWLSQKCPGNSNRKPKENVVAFFLILLFVPASSNLLADESSTGSVELVLTLNAAIELALERNTTLLNRRLDSETERLSFDIEQGRYRPTFTLGSNNAYDRNDVSGVVNFGTNLRIPTGGDFALTAAESIAGDDPSNPSLVFSQPLLKGAGENIDRIPLTRGRLAEKKRIFGLKDTVRTVVVNTIDAYRALIQAIRQVEISEASLQRAKQQLEVSRALIQAGRIARREITRSEATVASRELALVRSKNNLDSKNFALINVLDLDSSTRVQPVENLGDNQIQRVENGEIDVQESIATALRNRTEYLSAIVDVELAEITLRKSRNDELPDLKLTLNVERDRKKSRNIHSATLNLTIPLDRRPLKLDTMKAENGLIKARRNLEEKRESIGISVREAIKGVEVGYRVMELAGAARQLAEENLDIEQNKFSQGLSSTFEVAASEEALVTAQNSETDAIIAYLNALETLDQEMGQTLENWGIEVEEVPQ